MHACVPSVPLATPASETITMASDKIVLKPLLMLEMGTIFKWYYHWMG